MTLKYKGYIFHLVQLLWVLLLLFLQPQFLLAQEPNYHIISASIVPQGETHTGIVIEESDKGRVTLATGDKVVFKGEVLGEAEQEEVITYAEPGGRITLPAFTQIGNTFISAQIIPVTATEATSTISQHIEVVPVNPDVDTKIAHTSDIINSGLPIRVQGQGLSALDKAALVPQDGEKIDLGEPVGSSLEQIYLAPNNLPKETYRFVGVDKDGKQYEAPNLSKNPDIELEGTKITHVGQQGEITIISNADGKLMLSGGEPQIKLHQQMVDIDANVPMNVGFTAQQVGNYNVDVILLNPEDIVVSTGPAVDAKVEPIKTNYDDNRNETDVTAPVSVIDEQGKPVANALVDIAVSHPSGVEYDRVITDSGGSVEFSLFIPGQIATSQISAHVYRVLGYAWKQGIEYCECNPIKKTLVYSRGNNDDHELKAYFKKTKKHYIYETARFEFKFTGDPSKQCICDKGKCQGKFDLNLEMKILGLGSDPGYALLDGVDVKVGTTEPKKSVNPGPDVSTTSQKVDYPKSRKDNVLKKTDPAKKDLSALAKATVICTPGTYHKRFHLVPKAEAGKKNQVPGVTAGTPNLTAYVDATIEVKKVKGENPCKLNIEVKGYFLEFVPEYPWLAGADQELPVVEYDVPGLKKGKTRNIAKLIKEDGKKVDKPFPPK